MTSRISAMIQATSRSWSVRSEINPHRLSLPVIIAHIIHNTKQMIKLCNQSRPQRHSPFFPSGRKFQVIFNRNFHSKQLFSFEMKSTDNTHAIPQLINCPMALYGAIETLHGTEQSRAYPSRNILRDRHLKFKTQHGSSSAYNCCCFKL